ncbi:hypothetical protein [Arabiibacter massiliensis]|uniref:hypothetical protein n=1 Tax=Arabiibacter massiliensis TaxID=1870985 RepID=UPI0009BA2CCF|nr:hypothetical protein [Arabiibacter massiliensis]
MSSQTAPIEAAAAFASLYQRWFDDPRGLAEDNRRQARETLGAYVADVLTLWDERARAWLPGAPTILRLETCDLAAFAMREPHIALFVGSVETASPVAGLRWESFRPCSYAIGRTVADLVFDIDEDGLLASVEAVLDDGGRLLLGNRDARPLARAV